MSRIQLTEPVTTVLQTHLCRDLLFGPLSQPGQVSNLVPEGGNLPSSSPVVASHPFVCVPNQGGQPPATVQFSEGGPVRLTRFVEMSLDSDCAHLKDD